MYCYSVKFIYIGCNADRYVWRNLVLWRFLWNFIGLTWLKEIVLNITPNRLLNTPSELHLLPEIMNWFSEELSLTSLNFVSRIQSTVGMRCFFCEINVYPLHYILFTYKYPSKRITRNTVLHFQLLNQIMYRNNAHSIIRFLTAHLFSVELL